VSSAAAILSRLDAILREVVALRDEVAASLPVAEGNGLAADEQADALVDTTARPRPPSMSVPRA
jgi:hypothetical protein